MIGRGRDLSLIRDELAFTVKATSPQRLDHYLLKSLDWKSRTRIQRLIREGYVRVNGEESKPSRRVIHGDAVTIRLSMGVDVPTTYDAIQFEVLYEDRWIVAVNKPAGLLVHPSGRHVYNTLMNYMHHRHRGEVTEEGQPVVPRLCHRLDRDTTGVLVVGKDSNVHRLVQHQFENRLVTKEYFALVEGTLRDEYGKATLRRTIDIPIGEGTSLATCLDHTALKPSRTDVEVVREFSDYSLLACRPFTGRQNQIRVHLAAIGCPIVGDQRYGKGVLRDEFPDRYLLHSRKLRFFHPRWKSSFELGAELPEDFRTVVERLVTTNNGQRHA